MPLTLDQKLVEKWAGASTNEQIDDLKALIAQFSTMFESIGIDDDVKTSFISFVVKSWDGNLLMELQLLLLEMSKIIFRDRSSHDLDCFRSIASLLFKVAHLVDGEGSSRGNIQLLLEAEKCLINLLFNSSRARSTFEREAANGLIKRLAFMSKHKKAQEDASEASEFAYLNGLSEDVSKELYFYDLKIAFVTSAQMISIQQKWLEDTDKTNTFLYIVVRAVEEMKASGETSATEMDYKIASESLKILFNIYSHAKIFDMDVANKCGEECAKIINSTQFDFDLKQLAVNLLATMPLVIGNLCPKIADGEEIPENVEVHEKCNVEFAKCMLAVFEEAIDKLVNNDVQLLGTFFTAMINLCANNKAARRYCRLKIIPPLTAKEVERPPEEGELLRNKIIRLMRSASRVHDLAAELLFVLCKRSVNRMIKYCGFGHSAGLLANYGFLGQAATARRSASDSEDSETDDYRQVEEKVNPITGFIPSEEQLAEFRRTIDSMSEEQKEYEAMKLANTLSKLMDEGVLAPATIGADGRPRQVEHVAELIKDVKEEKKESSSDDEN